MTFTKEQMEGMRLCMDDDWQMHEDTGLCSFMVLGLEGPVEAFFGADMEKDFPDGWTDVYAEADPVLREVAGFYAVLVPNAGPDVPERELQLKVTNRPEAKALFARLAEDGGKAFMAFIKEAEKELRRGDAAYG